MESKKITAIIRNSVLGKVEERLQSLGVKGISVSRVTGYGEYANLFRSDWMVPHYRLEIFAKTPQTDAIVTAIMEAAHLGMAGDGIVAVLPVERLYRIRTKSEATDEEI